MNEKESKAFAAAISALSEKIMNQEIELSCKSYTIEQLEKENEELQEMIREGIENADH